MHRDLQQKAKRTLLVREAGDETCLADACAGPLLQATTGEGGRRGGDAGSTIGGGSEQARASR